jgi:hypothetical protein
MVSVAALLAPRVHSPMATGSRLGRPLSDKRTNGQQQQSSRKGTQNAGTKHNRTNIDALMLTAVMCARAHVCCSGTVRAFVPAPPLLLWRIFSPCYAQIRHDEANRQSEDVSKRRE